MENKTLDALGLKYKTDKSSMTHCYLDTYEKYFKPLRNKEIILLELGVAGQASINMWRQYFTKAKVYGVDNNPECAGEGIFIGDATDDKFMDSVLYEIGDDVDILVEDSSHIGWDMIKIFEFMFPKLKHGGYFFLEDTHVLYNSHYEQGSGAFNFFTGLVKDVDIAGRAMTGNTEYAINHSMTEPPVPKYSRILDSIHIHPSLWVFKRK